MRKLSAYISATALGLLLLLTPHALAQDSSAGTFTNNGSGGITSTMTNDSTGETIEYSHITQRDGTVVKIKKDEAKGILEFMLNGQTYITDLQGNQLIDGVIPDTPSDRRLFDPATGESTVGTWKDSNGTVHTVSDDPLGKTAPTEEQDQNDSNALKWLLAAVVVVILCAGVTIVTLKKSFNRS